MTAATSDEIELNVELDVIMVDGMAQLCSDMDRGAPGVVPEHFDVPPSLLSSSPLPSFTRRVTSVVVNLSLGVVDIRCVT